MVVLRRVYERTPAAEAGFREMDAIFAVGEQAIRTTADLVRAIEHSNGTIVVRFKRQGETKEVTVRLKPVKPTK